jgi:hypothetical protein
MTDVNTEQNQEDSIVSDVVVIPPIEENIPLPKNSYQALPSMSNEEEVMVRAKTIKEISDMTGEQIAPDAKNMEEANKIAQEMVNNPAKKQEFAIQPSPTIAFLAGMVGSMNHMIVKDLADLKLYVVNKLVEIVEHTENAKERTAALRAIGEVDGVDAFKKKADVTAKEESIDDVERELLKLLTEFKESGSFKAKPEPQTIDAELVEDEPVEEVVEVKEKSFDDIMQEATDGNTSGA